jgi:hypothetical protein
MSLSMTRLASIYSAADIASLAYSSVLVRTGGDQRVLRKPATATHPCTALVAACKGVR